jgi:uncharacterized repeat protein (TIGR03803 family)
MRIQNLTLLSAALFLSAANAPAASYFLVHSFGVLTNVSGFQPKAALVQDASGTLYGTASTSEGDLMGTIFKMQSNGTDFQVLMNFSAPVDFTNSNGANPEGGLTISGTTLYGTTYKGGPGGSGTIFTLNTDGSDFTVLTNFSATSSLTNSLGAHPSASMILSGSTLYGTTQGGGLKGNGTVFSVNVNGTGLTVLKYFSALNGSTNSDGAVPDGPLVLSGNTLYGTTTEGGAGGNGTVFRISTGGGNFTVLTNFPATAEDPFTFAFTNSAGANPSAGMILSGGTLFGTASGGGVDGSGTVFMVNTNGSGLAPVYTFTGGNDGALPDGGVIVSGNMLYGTTSSGGDTGFGTIFALNTNDASASFTDLYEFDGGSDDGGYPIAGLLLSGNTLYGSTAGVAGPEDTAGGNGTLFSINTSGSDFDNLYTFTYSDGAEPYGGGLVNYNNVLYGTTYEGGSGGNGIVFHVNPDGTDYTVIKNFSPFEYDSTTTQATNGDGANPQAGLVVGGSTLYGVTYYGGANGYGDVFAVNATGSEFTNLYSFTGGNDGAFPQGNLAYSNGVLYGTTVSGGANNNGTVFSIDAGGANFTVVKAFSATTSNTNGDGANPYGGLLLSGGVLYGTTYNGGTNGDGTVFSLNASTTNFANLHNFTDGADGSHPYGSLILSGSTLYGTAFGDTVTDFGTVFAVNTNASGFTNLYNFTGTNDGADPAAGVVLFGNTLYGTTVYGGSNGYGTAFSLETNGGSGNFATLYTFAYADGANPYAGLLLDDNALYGTTFGGGDIGDGTVFGLTLFPLLSLNIQRSGSNVILTWSDPIYSLQSAPNANGPYATILGATSPYTNAISASHEFFRLTAN